MTSPSSQSKRRRPVVWMVVGVIVFLPCIALFINSSVIMTAYYRYQANNAVEREDWDAFLEYAVKLNLMKKERVAEKILLDHRESLLKASRGVPVMLAPYSVPALLTFLGDKDKKVRLKSLTDLQLLSGEHTEDGPLDILLIAVPQIVPLLSDPDEEIRIMAYTTISAMGINPWDLQREHDPTIIDAPTTPASFNKPK